MTDGKLTKMVVLHAVVSAIRPYSNYINDEVQRWHGRNIRSGGAGHTPRASLVLARLKALVDDGLIEQSPFANGYYGYTWTITDAGRVALGTDR